MGFLKESSINTTNQNKNKNIRQRVNSIQQVDYGLLLKKIKLLFFFSLVTSIDPSIHLFCVHLIPTVRRYELTSGWWCSHISFNLKDQNGFKFHEQSDSYLVLLSDQVRGALLILHSALKWE